MRGMSLKDLMAGYFAKKEGCQGGRVPTGSHMYGDLTKTRHPDARCNWRRYPCCSWSATRVENGQERCSRYMFFGDGACNRGDFHEGVNLAAAFKTPCCLFALMNNGYSMSVPVEKSTGLKRLSVRAKAYGIPGTTVDGNDVRQVFYETSKAIARARETKGPSLIECVVHRWAGHSITDADVYRTDDKRKKGEEKDPVARFRKELTAEGILTDAEYGAVEECVRREIEDAVQYSEKECTPPPPSDIERGVLRVLQ